MSWAVWMSSWLVLKGIDPAVSCVCITVLLVTSLCGLLGQATGGFPEFECKAERSPESYHPTTIQLAVLYTLVGLHPNPTESFAVYPPCTMLPGHTAHSSLLVCSVLWESDVWAVFTHCGLSRWKKQRPGVSFWKRMFVQTESHGKEWRPSFQWGAEILFLLLLNFVNQPHCS